MCELFVEIRQFQIVLKLNISQAMKKRVLFHMRTTKAQISLRIRAV